MLQCHRCWGSCTEQTRRSKENHLNSTSGKWSRGTGRSYKQRAHRNIHMCYSYLLSLHTETQGQRRVCLEISSFIFLHYTWEWASLTPVQVQPSVFLTRELYFLKASTWMASHRSQRSPNLKKSNGNVKRCPSGTGKGLPSAFSSSSLCRAVHSHGVCGCVSLFKVSHASIFFSWHLRLHPRIDFSFLEETCNGGSGTAA